MAIEKVTVRMHDPFRHQSTKNNCNFSVSHYNFKSIYDSNGASYPYNFIADSQNSFSGIYNKDDCIFLDELKKKYINRFVDLTKEYKDPESQKLGIEIVKLTNECNKEILYYAEKNKIDFIVFQGVSTKELRETTTFIDNIFKTIEENNPDFFEDISNKDVSFKSSSKVKNVITKNQKAKAHLIIHTASMVCAGISAVMGEACATGADIPVLITAETGMFCQLIDNFDTSLRAGMLHAAKYMFSAKMAGGRALMWLNSLFSIGGHAAAVSTTGGLGNMAISGYLRASNAALSAILCEYMGWMFVRDYQNGHMNVGDKSREGLAFIAFMGLVYGYEHFMDLEKTAEILQEKTAKALGANLAHNLSGNNAEFVQAAMKFIGKDTFSMAAKGFEIVTPAIASHLIENKGKLNQDFLEQTLKGSIFALICGDIFSDISDGKIIGEKSKKLIAFMMQDKELNQMLENSLKKHGIKQAGEIVLSKNTVKSLESLYNEVVPKALEIVKAARSL